MKRQGLFALAISVAALGLACSNEDTPAPNDTGVATDDTGTMMGDTGMAGDGGTTDADAGTLPTFNQFVIDQIKKNTTENGSPVAIDPAPFMPPPAPEADDPKAFTPVLP